MYQAFAFTCVADMPSYFVALFSCSYIGRKKTVLGSLLLAGTFVGGLALVPQTFTYKYVINIALSMIAKFFTTNAFNGIFRKQASMATLEPDLQIRVLLNELKCLMKSEPNLV